MRGNFSFGGGGDSDMNGRGDNDWSGYDRGYGGDRGW